MTDTFAWILLSWLLPIVGCAICIFVTLGCVYFSIDVIADIINKIKRMLRR